MPARADLVKGRRSSPCSPCSPPRGGLRVAPRDCGSPLDKVCARWRSGGVGTRGVPTNSTARSARAVEQGAGYLLPSLAVSWDDGRMTIARETPMTIAICPQTGVAGKPFNVASASLLTLMLAQVAGLRPGELVHSFGDVHIYLNHLEQVLEQRSRTPRPLPSVRLNPSVTDIGSFTAEDITLEGYDPWPAIKAPVAV